MISRCLVALAALPVFAQAPQYTNPRPVERAIQNLAPQMAPRGPAQPALKLPETRPPRNKRLFLFFRTPSPTGVCSVPLLNTRKTAPGSLDLMPKLKPQRRGAPMPLVKLPAPPCPE